MSKITRKTVKLTKTSRALMRRSLRLLDMEYKPAEIAEELSTNPQHILRLVAVGAPARKDAKGRYWIHGETFARWMVEATPKNDRDLKARPTMAENECYCVTCHAITTYTAHRKKGHMVYGKCPKGHNITRFMSRKATGKATINERKEK